MRTVCENPYWRNESQFSNQDLNRQNYIPNHTTGHSVRTAITNVFRHKPSCKVMNAALSAYQWLMTQHSQWLYNHGVFYISVELLMLTQPVFALGLGGWLSHSGGGAASFLLIDVFSFCPLHFSLLYNRDMSFGRLCKGVIQLVEGFLTLRPLYFTKCN